MRILGISCYFHDAAAALIDNGVLVAAAEEERFSRIKHDYSYPSNAIQFCLDHAGMTGADLDYVVFFEKPFVKFDRIMKTAMSGFPKTYWMFAQSMRTWLFDKLWVKSLIAKEVGIDEKRILFSEHHISHAASAYFCSPFDESAVLTYDGVGEWASTTIGTGKANDLKISRELHFPHSMGLLYSAFTAFLGFEVNEGEYKVMGMAPYGTPRYKDKVWEVVHLNEDGSYWLDPKYFAFHYSTKHSYTKQFSKLFGKPRNDDIPFFTETSGYPSYYGDKPANWNELCEYNQYYADIAASIQSVTEDLIVHLAKEVHKETGMKRLCLAGGVALNSVANQKILNETPFEELYIQPSAGDGGGALGAALFAWHTALGNKERFVMKHAYWGQEYSQEEIQAAINASPFTGQCFEDDTTLVDRTVDRLLDGKVIGWFQGRFEWGPRALGNRSILGDPRRAEMKDVVNTKIKFREPFRPFAPSVVAESADRFFNIEHAMESMPARFMLQVVPVKDEHKDTVPAVNHLGTARLQTVFKDTNPRYHQLIGRFGEATGVPVLLNTSFNVRGEPVVNTPANALNTFANSGIDTLVMGNYVIDKP